MKKILMIFKKKFIFIIFTAGLLSCSQQNTGNEDSSNVNKDYTIMSSIFTSDPTLQESNGDGIYDWVIRGYESDHFDQHTNFSIMNDAFRSEGGSSGGICLDSRPRQDYPDHTELLFSARSVNNNNFTVPTVGQTYTSFVLVGNLTWINFDYDETGTNWAAVFTMIYKNDDEQVLFIVNQVNDAPASTDLIYKVLYVQTGLPVDDFINVKLHLYIFEGKIGINVNGEDKGKVFYERKIEASSNDDRFITLYSTQETTAEWKSAALQVDVP